MTVPETVSRLTRITDDEVRGFRLDDDAEAAVVTQADLVIAHNARFDRRFLERHFPLFIDNPWGCTREQVPWAAEGLSARAVAQSLGRSPATISRELGRNTLASGA